MGVEVMRGSGDVEKRIQRDASEWRVPSGGEKKADPG